MNHRILKLLRLLGAPLLAAAAVFGSCTTELESTTLPPDGGSGKGEQEVLLRLNVPGTTKPGEKARKRRSMTSTYWLSRRVRKTAMTPMSIGFLQRKVQTMQPGLPC